MRKEKFMKKTSIFSIIILAMIAICFLGTQSVYAMDLTTTAITTEATTETAVDVTTVLTGDEVPLDEAGIKAAITTVIEQNLGWLLAILGISAGTLAGIIYGIIKVIYWLKNVYLSNQANKTVTEENTVSTHAAADGFQAIAIAINQLNKTQPLQLYIAKALDTIINNSQNDGLVAQATELHTLYQEGLLARDAEVLDVKKLFEDTRAKAVRAANKVITAVESKSQQVSSTIELIKKNLEKKE